MELKIKKLNVGYIERLAKVSEGIRPPDYFETCLGEVAGGKRLTLIAFEVKDGGCIDVAGWGNLIFESQYGLFRENGIPEINDLYVFDGYRNRGIGGKLLGRLEEEARGLDFRRIGLGVGLYADYGAAQRLYVRGGYVPDGKGIHYDYRPVEPGAEVRADDDLLIFLVKELG